MKRFVFALFLILACAVFVHAGTQVYDEVFITGTQFAGNHTTAPTFTDTEPGFFGAHFVTAQEDNAYASLKVPMDACAGGRAEPYMIWYAPGNETENDGRVNWDLDYYYQAYTTNGSIPATAGTQLTKTVAVNGMGDGDNHRYFTSFGKLPAAASGPDVLLTFRIRREGNATADNATVNATVGVFGLRYPVCRHPEGSGFRE